MSYELDYEEGHYNPVLTSVTLDSDEIQQLMVESTFAPYPECVPQSPESTPSLEPDTYTTTSTTSTELDVEYVKIALDLVKDGVPLLPSDG
jgi:hypothetical protein